MVHVLKGFFLVPYKNQQKTVLVSEECQKLLLLERIWVGY